MRTRIRFAILSVAISAAVLFGGASLNHSSSPAEASSVHVAATQEPVPAANAQPTQRVHRSFLAVPFYWQGFRNWDTRWCAGLFSDSGQLLYFYCY